MSANLQDRIHIRQSKGVFYEDEDLAGMAQHMLKGGRFCDAGTNVDTEKSDAFHALMDQYDNEVVRAIKETRKNHNVLMKPVGA